MIDNPEILETINEISKKLRGWQYEYYVLAQPTVSDAEYDSLFDQLSDLEKEYPHYQLADSPTQRVGSDLTHDLPEARHTIPVLSLDKAYSVEELLEWKEKKISRGASGDFSVVVEQKMDGISIVLYYEEGLLVRAVTRGNGEVGNDVTANVKTIGSVPLRLPDPETVAVRGEIYLPLAQFEQLNRKQDTPYANPRNLAAGTIRRIRSSETAAVPLQIFVYEGFFEGDHGFKSHREVLERLSELGFRLNDQTAWFSTTRREGYQSFSTLEQWVRGMTEGRPDLPYEIDGLVVKVNELALREELGYTGHHPRWAIAYKFESPMGESVIRDIDIQVGRTGRITPVARIEPVEISGSVVSNVTLHNQDYINALEAAPGDRVAVSKRGDVIPAVESVVEKGENGAPWQMPDHCPSCGGELIQDGAHLFCRNPQCPDQQLGRMLFFCGRSQMDIDGLGDETVQFLFRENLVQDLPSLYRFDYTKLLSCPGFGEKKVALIEEGLERSKQQPYVRVLASLGIPDLGPKACELLTDAGFRDVESLIRAASDGDQHLFEAVKGIGPRTAAGIVDSLTLEENVSLIEELKSCGLQFSAPEEVKSLLSQPFAGQSWCVTGSFENFKPRTLAADEIKKRGGKVVSAVSGSTTCLLAGEKSGSKLVKAENLGVRVVDEAEFLALLSAEEEDSGADAAPESEVESDDKGQQLLF